MLCPASVGAMQAAASGHIAPLQPAGAQAQWRLEREFFKRTPFVEGFYTQCYNGVQPDQGAQLLSCGWFLRDYSASVYNLIESF